MLAFVVWEGLAGAVTGRRSWPLGLGVVVLGIGFTVFIGGNGAAGQAPLTVPTGSESAKVQALAGQFPEGDWVPLILVVSRVDGAVLNSVDVTAAKAARDRMQALTHPFGAVSPAPPMVSADGKGAIGVVLIRSDLSGSVLNDGVAALRTAARTGLPAGLLAHVTGGPAFGADIANAFTDANVTLLAVTASVVTVLLIATYRSPVLWLAPLLVIGFADRVATAVGTAVASLTGLSFDGGWASMHVFGFPALDDSTPLFAFLFLAALGVDYTIFLVTRAREEAAQHGARDGMIRAVSATGGVINSAGIVLAAVFCVLGVLPLIVLTQLGIIVGLGILLDTFIVRTLVIPALFALIGDRIWWPATNAKPVAQQAGLAQHERSTV